VDPGSVGPVDPDEELNLKSGSGTGSGKAKCPVLKKEMFSLNGWSPEK
jgi:hypothetical protein